MKNEKRINKGFRDLRDALLEMDAPQVRRLWSLAHAAIRPAYLKKVIEQMPLTLEESKIYAQFCKSVFVSQGVKALCWARLKGLGEKLHENA